MFFALSKILNYLVMPLTLVVIVLIVSFFVRGARWRRWLRIGGVLMLLIFSNEFVANELMRHWEMDTRPYANMQPYKLGIVLTGAVIPELEPDDRVYFQRGADRVVHTVQLYKLGLIEKILVSGGSGRLVDIGEREADAFKEAMVLMGVPDTVILLENKTRNTHESAVAVKAMLAGMEYDSRECLLITSAFHMRRSLACYHKQDLYPDPFTTDFYAHAGTYYADAFFVPKVEALVMWQKLIREWVGMLAYRAAGYI